jgi:hypothetical protein
MDVFPKSICKYCQAVPFLKLPSEDEPGFPHRPSLASLKASAATCPLCFLLLNSVYLVRDNIENDQRRESKTEACWLEYFTTKKPSGKNVMEVTSMGAYNPGSCCMATTLGLEETMLSTSEGYNFASDDVVAPYLYGNWWKVDKWKRGDGKQLQLLGIGVRLATSPDVLDAEGNHRDRVDQDGKEEDYIRYRGSYLRIRTDDGMASP